MMELTVNGKSHVHEGEGQLPLLWYLRDILGLKGTKFGCGEGLCGACTVHVDGYATRSCLMSMSAVAGRAVTTIEGLEGPEAEALADAWTDASVPQCGYCQSGQIMQAASLLRENPDPDGRAIDDAMWGNLCRCGTYQRIRTAIRSAAAKVRE